MSILTVGVGQQYSSLSKAVAAAQDGDTIKVQAGTYTNDFTTISKDLIIEGTGGMAKFVATIAPPNGKAIMVTKADVTIRNLEFSGAKVADDNGAGIRYESGNLVVEKSYFHHNQMGLLSNGDPAGTITIRDSEFAFNGGGDGYTHGLYVNGVRSLVVEGSYFHDANNGHHVKSRAANTTLTNNRILDGANGISSYNIDLPNGGNAVLQGNVIQQNAKSPNVAIVSYGAEGNLKAGSSLVMTDNVVIDDHASTNVRLLSNRTSIQAKLVDTDVWGLGSAQLASGPVSISGTEFLSARPSLDTSSPWNVAPAPVTPTPVPPTPVPPTPVPSDLVGTSGNDKLVGTSGDDTISGLGGSDTLDGGAGSDTLEGGTGRDILDGGTGGDKMLGGTGDDTYYVDSLLDVPVELSWEGLDTVNSSVSFTLAQYFENLQLVGVADLTATGNNTYNSLFGNAGDNILKGMGGNDRLDGGDGNDRLEGGSGNDRLQGESGTDTQVGGTGADTFIWNDPSHAGLGASRDVILDFVQGSDKIDLSGIDAQPTAAGSQAFTFIGSNAFAGDAGQLRFQEYEASTGDYTLVQGDLNGDKIADFEIKLAGELPDLRATDFLL